MFLADAADHEPTEENAPSLGEIISGIKPGQSQQQQTVQRPQPQQPPQPPQQLQAKKQPKGRRRGTA
ncbi:MAG: hypothetical protein QXN16_03850, partial [Candidatus Micrarchaeaceae archaeon]